MKTPLSLLTTVILTLTITVIAFSQPGTQHQVHKVPHSDGFLIIDISGEYGARLTDALIMRIRPVIESRNSFDNKPFATFPEELYASTQETAIQNSAKGNQDAPALQHDQPLILSNKGAVFHLPKEYRLKGLVHAEPWEHPFTGLARRAVELSVTIEYFRPEDYTTPIIHTFTITEYAHDTFNNPKESVDKTIERGLYRLSGEIQKNLFNL